MNGHMAEAQKGVATLEDVDYDTLVRFIQWAHKGYYTAARFKTVETESRYTPRSQNHDEDVYAPEKDYGDEAALEPQVEYVEEALEPQVEYVEEAATPMELQPVRERRKGKKNIHKGWQVEDNYDQWGMSRNRTAHAIKDELKEAFISRRYSARKSVFEVPRPRSNQDSEEDYTDVFLSHAQLYVFAEKYDIQPLKYLALEELHATLAIYTLYPLRTGDITALLRYVYRNTGQSNGGEEELRQMLTVYIGCEMDTLMDDEDFRDLMIEDGGPLLGDFMTMVARRIS